jgi:hypothetical protein
LVIRINSQPWLKILLKAGTCLLLSALAAQAGGLYAIWYSREPQVLALPYLSGEQVIVQWSDLQSGPSSYSWGVLDSAVAANTGRPFTVQVDGGTKPTFLFNIVPYVTNPGGNQSSDKYLLMYWHPTYISTYTGFITALAAYLDASPYRSLITGLRQNYDGIGTEYLTPVAADQPASAWTVPPGVTNGPDWTSAISYNYEQTVIDSHLSAFGTGTSSIPVFLRATTDSAVLTRHATGQPSGFTYESYWLQGLLRMFHTTAQIEPPGAWTADEYSMFLNYALPGYTVGYAEPQADAWGSYGVGTQPAARWCTPPQANYWRLLSDLNMGVSDIALYGDDLTVAYSATHQGANVGSDYQSEFDQAFRFTRKYARNPTDAAGSPGAWIAFRQTTTDVSPSDYNTLVTDYRRFITLLNPQDTVSLDARKNGVLAPVVKNRTVSGEYTIGPYNQRFGAWARSIPAGNTAELQLDAGFLATVNSRVGAEINVTYLDNVAGASFTATFGAQSVTTTLINTGLWQTVAIPVTSTLVQDSGGGNIAITSTGGAVTFHMVEVSIPKLAKVGTYNAGQWLLDVNANGVWDASADRSATFGWPGASYVTGDWNGDGRTKMGVFYNGYWYLDYDGNGVWDGGVNDKAYVFGFAGATPVVGDWNGDGKTKIGVYYNGLWYLDFDGNGAWDGGVNDKAYTFGWNAPGVTPMLGDWNGDGRTKIGIYYNGFWYLDYDGSGSWDGGVRDKAYTFGWAAPGVTPLVGDWSGNGTSKIGIFYNGYWYLDYDGNGVWDGGINDKGYVFGWTGVTPVIGDWSGGGTTKIGIFYNGYWYLDFIGNGIWDGGVVDRSYVWGRSGDIPLAGNW